MKHYIQDLITKQKQGSVAGIYSVCSAHPWVLRAAFMRGKQDGVPVLVEATSNQVNQDGGYTGMKPADFTSYINSIAASCQFDISNIILGGDHLGPNAWQSEDADTAMQKANILVSQCVEAGFRKIHLDASMHCKDDANRYGTVLPDEIVAARAASMCLAAEESYKNNPVGTKPIYVIGTEVPVPGGAQTEGEQIHVTSVEDVTRTITIAREAFGKLGLNDAWSRVIAVVVQPGVEFNNSEIIEYNRDKAAQLSSFIKSQPSLTFEAHSTDYQTKHKLTEMVEDQFGILKVGPWLTFAFREAVFALSSIERELLGKSGNQFLGSVPQIMDAVMQANPFYWDKYYKGSEVEREFARKYSLSDRSRYYWGNATVNVALDTLLKNLEAKTIPYPLLSQYMPMQYEAIREGKLANNASALIIDKIDEVLRIYSGACKTEH